MITYGGRVLNTYKTNPVSPINTLNSDLVNPPNVYKGGTVETNPVTLAPINSNPENSPNTLHGGGMSEDKIEEKIEEKINAFMKEQPKELYNGVRNAFVKGTMLGQLLGPLAWPCSWAWWIFTNILKIIMYICILCFVICVIAVIQMGLDMTHAAIEGILFPLKAVYDIKIAGGRLFGFLGGPVDDLNRSNDSIARTVLELLFKIAMDLIK